MKKDQCIWKKCIVLKWKGEAGFLHGLFFATVITYTSLIPNPLSLALEVTQHSNSLWKKWKCWLLNCLWLFATPWTVAHQAPLSMGFSRQKYWSGLPCPPPGDLPDLGIEHRVLMSPVLAGGSFTISITWEAHSEYLQFPQNCCLLSCSSTLTSVSSRHVDTKLQSMLPYPLLSYLWLWCWWVLPLDHVLERKLPPRTTPCPPQKNKFL